MKCNVCGCDPCETPGFCEHCRRRDAAGYHGHLIMPDKTVHPLSIAENAHLILSNDPHWNGKLSYDEMLRKTMIVSSAAEPLQDHHVVEIQCWLQRQGGLRRIGKAPVWDAVDRVCREHGFHPVRDYLRGLEWDELERLDGWLARYCGAEDTDYSATIGRLFLVSMVARILRPGCQADHMLILEGPQGALKSSVCRILGGDWYSENLRDVDSKDASIAVRGKWLLEWPELHTFSRTEATGLKAFLTRTHERFRPPYLREDVIEPRQCVFVGTSNKDTYLKDETGGRRFWPVKCGAIDLPALRADRDQLFAEAVARFDDGEPWWPDASFEAAHIAPQQEARYEADEWTGPIGDYLHLLIADRVTIPELAKTALGLEYARLGMPEQKRIGAILRKTGWALKVSNGKRWWQRSPSAT